VTHTAGCSRGYRPSRLPRYRVHIAETYGRSHRGRAGTAKAITDWAEQHRIPLVDLKAAVGEYVMSGQGNPDGIHWNFEGHQAVAELMLKGLAEAGAATAATSEAGVVGDSDA
jgi:lysophospholipase L1-like esterase